MATDDDRRRIALQNECLLNKYAQRQLKALELDLKCAHAKSLHQTRRRNSHNACDPPSTTLSSNLPATVASSSSSSSSLVLSTIDMNTFSIEPADYTDRSATITSSTDAEDEFGDFQANADIQSDSTTTLMHMMLTNSSVLDQATRPDLLGLPNEFGRFQSHSTDHQLDLWTRLMTCIRRTLTRCCDLLLTSKMPLPSIRQALATPRGCNFCLDLVEVQRVFERVRFSYSKGQRRVQIEQLIAEIQKKFTALRSLFVQTPYFQTNSSLLQINVNPRSVQPSLTESQCQICFCSADSNDRDSHLLQFCGRHYHLSCANLWLNCVDLVLPSLAQASQCTQSSNPFGSIAQTFTSSTASPSSSSSSTTSPSTSSTGSAAISTNSTSSATTSPPSSSSPSSVSSASLTAATSARI